MMRDAIAIASAATSTGDVPVGAIVINKDAIQLHTLRLSRFVTLPADFKIPGLMVALSL